MHELMGRQGCGIGSIHPAIQPSIALSKAALRFEARRDAERFCGGSVLASRSCRYTSNFAAEKFKWESQQWSSSFWGSGSDEFTELLLAD
jgi:hypothetical protein